MANPSTEVTVISTSHLGSQRIKVRYTLWKTGPLSRRFVMVIRGLRFTMSLTTKSKVNFIEKTLETVVGLKSEDERFIFASHSMNSIEHVEADKFICL